MNPDLGLLQPYPFEKLAGLKRGVEPPPGMEHIALSIGEPKHPTPQLISDALIAHLHGLASYPTTRGTPQLREAIASWLTRRFALGRAGIDAETQILPLNGTREGLFAFAQAMLPHGQGALVLLPNPFYQIYEGAALLAGAEPGYLACADELGLIPDFDSVSEAQWRRCQLLYLCSPGNPTGAVIPREVMARLIELSQRHDFIIAADECYSELYFDEHESPVGLLQVAAEQGLDDYRNLVAFHSLSKRSNAPGLRSGFAAGDARLIERFFRYRTYHGCAMPLQHQFASIAAWSDEAHVRRNRDLYRAKFEQVLAILGDSLDVARPAAGFYLWPRTPIDDATFARELYRGQNVTVLPGSYLSREVDGKNPGHGRARMALVATLEECIEAAGRIRRFVEAL